MAHITDTVKTSILNQVIQALKTLLLCTAFAFFSPSRAMLGKHWELGVRLPIYLDTVSRKNITKEVIEALQNNNLDEALALCQKENVYMDYEHLTNQVLKRKPGSTFELRALEVLKTAKKINPTYGDRYGSENLMEACVVRDRPDVFQVLSTKTKNFLSKIESHPDILDYAIEQKHVPIINLILNTKDFADNPHKLLHYSDKACNSTLPLEILRVILQKAKELKWNIDQVAKNGCTPLVCAVVYGNTPAVQLLSDENDGTEVSVAYLFTVSMHL